jgi:hypothetical protein
MPLTKPSAIATIPTERAINALVRRSSMPLHDSTDPPTLQRTSDPDQQQRAHHQERDLARMAFARISASVAAAD